MNEVHYRLIHYRLATSSMDRINIPQIISLHILAMTHFRLKFLTVIFAISCMVNRGEGLETHRITI